MDKEYGQATAAIRICARPGTDAVTDPVGLLKPGVGIEEIKAFADRLPAGDFPAEFARIAYTGEEADMAVSGDFKSFVESSRCKRAYELDLTGSDRTLTTVEFGDGKAHPGFIDLDDPAVSRPDGTMAMLAGKGETIALGPAKSADKAFDENKAFKGVMDALGGIDPGEGDGPDADGPIY